MSTTGKMCLESAERKVKLWPASREAHDSRIVAVELMEALVEDVMWAYVAGIVDGEGTIGLTLINDKKRNRRFIRPYILIGNTKVQLFEYLDNRITKGSITKERSQERKKLVYRWQVTAKPIVLSILRNILPHLFLKRAQAELVLEYYERRGERRFLANDDLIYWRRIKILNERGIPIGGLQLDFSEAQGSLPMEEYK